MHALWRLIVRTAALPARFGRWLYLLGHEEWVSKHKALPTTAYLTTQIPEDHL